SRRCAACRRSRTPRTSSTRSRSGRWPRSSPTGPRSMDEDPEAAAEAAEVMAAAPQVLGDDGRVGMIQVAQDIERIDVTADDKAELIDIMDQYRGDGLEVEATGGLMQAMDMGGAAELIGFAVAFVVMIVAFG